VSLSRRGSICVVRVRRGPRRSCARSTPDGRSAAGTTYEGPRRHEWQWDGTTLRHRYPGGAWEDSGETPNYQRHVLPPADG